MKLQDYLHLYLGCEIVYEGEISRLESIASSGLVGDENRDEDGEGWYHIDDIKPILRPLSDMTEGEKAFAEGTKKPITYTYGIEKTVFYIDTPDTFHYLLSKHFDLFGLHDAGLCYYKNENNELY